MKSLLTFLSIIAAFGCAAQDTTGSTRPMIVIPLKKVEPKTQEASGIADSPVVSKYPLNADDRKLKMAADRKKAAAAKKRSTKKPMRP